MIAYIAQGKQTTDYTKLSRVLQQMVLRMQVTKVLTGSDNLTRRWCIENNVPCSYLPLSRVNRANVDMVVAFKGYINKVEQLEADVLIVTDTGC